MLSGGLKKALTENPLSVFLTHDNKSFKTATNHDEPHLRHKLGPLFRHDENKACNQMRVVGLLTRSEQARNWH